MKYDDMIERLPAYEAPNDSSGNEKQGLTKEMPDSLNKIEKVNKEEIKILIAGR